MNFSFSSAQVEWVEKARACGEEFAERARQYDEEAAFPAEDFERLKAEGFLKLPVPKRFGGYAGASGNCNLTAYLAIRELAKYSSSTAWDLMIHFHQSGVLARVGDDEQRERIFGDVVKDDAIMGSLGSETDPTQFRAADDTKTGLVFEAAFRPVEGGFLATGRKHFCSMAPAADYLLYWAVAPGASGRGEGLTQAIVPGDSEGLKLVSTGWHEVTGLRATISWSIELEEVFIPWRNVLGEPGDFVQEDPYTYELSQAFHLLGTVEGALDFIMTTLRERPYLMKDDTVVVTTGGLLADLQATEASLYHANWLWEQEQWSQAAISSIRALHAVKKLAAEVATAGYQVIGTRSLFKFHPFDLACRDARTASLHTRETQLMRLSLEGDMSGDYFPKQKYGERYENRRTWADLGLTRAGA